MPTIRFTAGAAAAAVAFSILLGVPGSAQGPAILTKVQTGSLHARRLLPNGATLTGMLLQVTTCNRVAFQRSPAQVVPPIYRAVQRRVSNGPCGQIVFYARASIAIPPGARSVTVQATNGTFHVPVL